MENNLELYNKLREVPAIAKKPITAGRLKGMTDINPMFRIKALTETFGPAGIGWWYIIDRMWSEPAGEKEIAAFVEIKLFYKFNGETSQPITGIGGSMLAVQESKGIHVSDECYKMALTDAISVAAKALGVGADVYWATDAESTKYSANDKLSDFVKTAPDVVTASDMICTECGHKIVDVVTDKGKWTAGQIASVTSKRYGRPVCYECSVKLKGDNHAD